MERAWKNLMIIVVLTNEDTGCKSALQRYAGEEMLP